MTAPRRQRGLIRLALVYAVLLVSLSGVVWRQSRALEALRQVDELRRQRAVVEADRAELLRRIQMLESRHRVVEFARERLGMHVPRSTEIVILRVPAGTDG